MTRQALTRLFVLAALLGGALLSSSCDSSSGIGMGVDYGARWGSGANGPSVIVGGPSR